MDDQQQEIVIAQSMLDRSWLDVETLSEWIDQLAMNGVNENSTKEEFEIAAICCEMVSRELALRILSRTQFLKCSATLTGDANLVKIEIDGYHGKVIRYVHPSYLRNSNGETWNKEQDAIVRIVAYRQVFDLWMAVIADLQSEKFLMKDGTLVFI